MLRFKRGNGFRNATYVGKDIYKFYLKNYKGNSPVSKKIYSDILKEGYSEIIKLIVFENMVFKMPQKLGYLRVKKRLVQPSIDKNGEIITKELSVDWKKTKDYWEKIYAGKTAEEINEIESKPVIRELNEHTDGYRVRWLWDKSNSVIKNKTYYKLKMTRTHNQFLSQSIKTVKNLNFYE